MPATYDAIVIGSGFGGAVTACRLAEKGMKRVLILERGRRWNKYPYGPRQTGDAWFWDQDNPQKANGWLDFRFFKQMWVAQCAGVGGGSLIYANISINAKPELFQRGWPSEITYQELEPYYRKVSDMLCPETIPENQVPERYRLMKEAAERIGQGTRFMPLPIAVTFNKDWDARRSNPHGDEQSRTWTNPHGAVQGTCTHCGNCVIGCQVRAKNTLDLNYLKKAENDGVGIRDLHLVRYIEPVGHAYKVVFDRILDNGRLEPGHETASYVIVAAGSLGSTELLLRSRDQYKTLPNISKCLGHNWSSNGDFLTPALYTNRRLSPTHGPTITSAIDFLDGTADGEPVFVEDGGFPDFIGELLVAALRSGTGNPIMRALSKMFGRHLQDRDALHGIMPWFGQAVDAADGRLYLRRRWFRPGQHKLNLDWNIDRSKKVVEAMVAMHKRLSVATGGLPLVPPTWSIFKTLITPHPLGGCNMGQTQADGVVDHRGKVFGYPRLYVADGAIIPEAVGLNPSKTIAALAERVAALMQ